MDAPVGTRRLNQTRTLASARTMQALEALVFEPTNAARLAAILQIHPRTARRLLVSLTDARYVERRRLPGRQGSTYAPTMRLLSLAVQLTRRSPAVEHASDVARALRRQTGLSAYAATPTHAEMLVLARTGAGAPGAWAVLPAKPYAVGQVLLAHRQRWRDQMGLSAEEEQAAATTRKRGYALTTEPGGTASLAVALPGRAEPELAVAVAGPAERLLANEQALATTVQDIAVT